MSDRCYFRSSFYREPGAVLFEIATKDPGFTIDEPVAALGESLKLPEWLESKRAGTEKSLVLIALLPIEKVNPTNE